MSIQSQIDKDPILKGWMERKIDYTLLNHQISLKFAAIEIALHRSLIEIK